DYDTRVEVARRIERALTIEAQREEMWTAPHTSTGDVLFICAVPSDTIAWCARQLGRGDHGATVVLGLGDDLIWATHLYKDISFADSAHPLNYYGWSSGTTLGA